MSTTDPIPFGGADSRDPLEFRFYEPSRLVGGKRMDEHLRFAVAWWHSFCLSGADPFGEPTFRYPWQGIGDEVDRALHRLDHGFDVIGRLGIPFYCFHDVDLVAPGDTPAETDRRMARVVAHAKALQQATGIRLLWGTANLFGHPRYMNGAATNPDFAVTAFAADQVRRAIDATVELGGSNYVFWGGREGYLSLHNTDTRREKEHLARFLSMAVEYGRRRGFDGTFLIEPKPMEPTKHQYDHDAETTIGFLREFGLDKEFKLNIEVNHATLAGHSFAHELRMAADCGMLGSIDANRGDMQNGWDTDQFPIEPFEVTEAMIEILLAGGFTTGGINFDAKLRRNSVDPDDLLIAHIAGMDTFARALLAAHAVLEESPYLAQRRARYASFDTTDGRRFEAGEMALEELADRARSAGEPEARSGRQEWFESLISRHL